MNEAQIVTDVDRALKTPSSGGLQLQEKAANEAKIGEVPGKRPVFSKALRTSVFYLLVIMILSIGWQHRGNVYISPEEGPGYTLGIVGGSMMLLLLMYPMRKHMRWTRGLGPVSYWFRTHMLLGILGPVCILYHCNFQLGSTNGNIALFSMLLVAGSGLVGRYFYTKLHYGLYGKKADLAHLSSDAAVTRSQIARAFEASPELHARLQNLEQQAVSPLHGFLSSMIRVLTIGIKTHWYGLTSGPALRKAFRNTAWYGKLSSDQRRLNYRHVKYYLHVYLGTVRKVAGLSFYERLFSLWHILHLPLFFMLLRSGFVHVYAVHMY